MSSGASDSGRFLYLNHLRDALMGTNGPLYFFYNIMFGGDYTAYTSGSLDTCSFHPAINGYNLVFMKPPHLSGYVNSGVAVDEEKLLQFTKMICFLAVDFTPPQIQVTASELPSRCGSLPYATEMSGTGQLSISYLDDQYEHNFGYHKVWLSYIEDITRGARTSDGSAIVPDEKYITPGFPEFGQIDYETSAFIIKFKPVQGTSVPGDIVYIGKATGIFPINSPDKEVIGRRDSPELVTTTYNYPCANYRQWTAGTPNTDLDYYLVDEFIKDIQQSWYSGFNILDMLMDVVDSIAKSDSNTENTSDTNSSNSGQIWV